MTGEWGALKGRRECDRIVGSTTGEERMRQGRGEHYRGGENVTGEWGALQGRRECDRIVGSTTGEEGM